MRALLLPRLPAFARKMSTSNEVFSKIREHLLKFPGGGVSVATDEQTGVATLKLSHPEKKNAISGVMMVQLRDSVEHLEKWQTGKALILKGSPGYFCSGGDLDFARATGTEEEASYMAIWMQDALSRLEKLSMFSVCLIDGICLGGGTEISVACDYILASEKAKFGVVHGKMGIITAWGGGFRLSKRVGHREALDLLLTSRILSGRECFEEGVADAVLPSDNFEGAVEEWLQPRLQHHYSVIRAMKDVVHNSRVLGNDKALERERIRFAPFWGGEVNREALEKRLKHLK